MTPHGTPNGYNAGCRGNGNCDNHNTALMTCAQSIIRYRGDYSYMLMVDAGMTPQQIVDAERAQLVLDRIARKAARRKPAKKKYVHAPYVSNGKPIGRPATPGAHGTEKRHKQGCKTDAQCPAVYTCRMDKNRLARESHARRVIEKKLEEAA